MLHIHATLGIARYHLATAFMEVYPVFFPPHETLVIYDPTGRTIAWHLFQFNLSKVFMHFREAQGTPSCFGPFTPTYRSTSFGGPGKSELACDQFTTLIFFSQVINIVCLSTLMSLPSCDNWSSSSRHSYGISTVASWNSSIWTWTLLNSKSNWLKMNKRSAFSREKAKVAPRHLFPRSPVCRNAFV